jgi:hypothetical protein
VSHPVVINLGVGRSGTTYIYNVMRERYADVAYALHEDLTARKARMRSMFRCYEPERIAAVLAEPQVAAWVERLRQLSDSRPVVVTGCTTSHLAPALLHVFGERLRTIHVHRHPLNVCAATYVGPWSTDWKQPKEWGADPNSPALTPDDPWVRHRRLERGDQALGPFAQIGYNWLERTGAGLEFSQRHPHVPHRELAAEREVFGSEAWLEAIAELSGLPVRRGDAQARSAQNSSWIRSLEERPLGDAWRQFAQLPELARLAGSLGHSFDEAELARRAAKYQLPPGIGSRLRHACGYWQARRRVAKLLRGRGWLPPRSGAHGGEQPRSTSEAISEAMRHLRGGGGQDG